MATPFDSENLDFSLEARKYATQFVYPDVFGAGTAQDTTGTHVDYNEGCDLIWLTDDGETIRLQERFRRSKYSHYRELTATAYNEATGRKGDFFKLDAEYYVYAYHEVGVGFDEAIIVDVDALKSSDIEPDEQYFPRKKQRFLCWPFDKLIDRGIHIFHERDI